MGMALPPEMLKYFDVPVSAVETAAKKTLRPMLIVQTTIYAGLTFVRNILERNDAAKLIFFFSRRQPHNCSTVLLLITLEFAG